MVFFTKSEILESNRYVVDYSNSNMIKINWEGFGKLGLKPDFIIWLSIYLTLIFIVFVGIGGGGWD